MKFERLGNIVTIHKGKKPVFTENPTASSVRVLQIDDLRNDSELKFTDDKAGVLATKDDILLAWDGANAGTIGYGKEGYIGSTIALLRKIQPEKYSTNFLGYFLQTQSKLLREKSTGATIPHIDRKLLESLKVPVLNITDQIRIATLLSKTETLITQRKEGIKLLDEYVNSVFAEMFGDPVRNEKKWKLKLLKNLSGVGSSKRVFVEELLNEGVPFYRGTEIGQLAEGIDVIPRLFISETHYELLKGYTGVPRIGDLLMPSICSDGRIFRVANNNPFYFKDGRVLWLSVNQKEINSLYLQSTLKAIFSTSYKSIASGTTFAELKIIALKQIKIPIPPKDLQLKYSLIVEKAEFLVNQLKSSLTDLKKLFGSLSQQAFKGELDLSNISVLAEEEYQAPVNDRDAYPNWESQYNIDNIEIKAKPKKRGDTKKYGEAFQVDEDTAKKQESWFYTEWLRLHGKTIEEENKSVWLQSTRNGLRPTIIRFNTFEGNAIIHEVFSKQHTGFGFKEFEAFLKTEKISYTPKEVKDFIFHKLEQKELLQYFASKEWMEAMGQQKSNPPGEYSEDCSIWFVVNKTDKVK